MKKSDQKLNRSFYTRNVLIVAKELLGKILVKRNGTKILSGRIAEVEAYDGSIDQAAHTFRGITERNKIMFGTGGFLYVYFTYGNHYCCNIVTGEEGSGTAVLIRAVEPVTGINIMIKNRFGRDLLNEKEKFNLTSGPGKVCRAFAITMDHYGTDLTGDEIYILDSPQMKPEEITVSRRIGIIKSVDLPWRFYIKENPYVSKK
ncbi:MAG: DNA-3-methyladenine glycosylase [Ignavibacteria bacterium]